MNAFIKLTHGDGTRRPVWVNPSHISEMQVSESTNLTSLVKTSEEDNPVVVMESPDQVNALIEALLTR